MTNNVEFYKDVKDFGEYRQWIQVLEEIITEGLVSIKYIFEDKRAICISYGKIVPYYKGLEIFMISAELQHDPYLLL